MNTPSPDGSLHFQPAKDPLTLDQASTNPAFLSSPESPADGENTAPEIRPEAGNIEPDFPSEQKSISNDSAKDDDAASDCTVHAPDTSTANRNNYVTTWLEANWWCMDSYCPFKAMADSGTLVDILSFAVAKEILGKDKIERLPKKVSVVSPFSKEAIWLRGPEDVKVRLRESSSRTRHVVKFYISTEEGAPFDSLLSLQCFRSFGLDL